MLPPSTHHRPLPPPTARRTLDAARRVSCNLQPAPAPAPATTRLPSRIPASGLAPPWRGTRTATVTLRTPSTAAGPPRAATATASTPTPMLTPMPTPTAAPCTAVSLCWHWPARLLTPCVTGPVTDYGSPYAKWMLDRTMKRRGEPQDIPRPAAQFTIDVRMGTWLDGGC